MSARDVYPITLNKGSMCLAITAGNIKYAGIDCGAKLISIVTEYRNCDNELKIKTYNITYDSEEDFEDEMNQILNQCISNGDHYYTTIECGTTIVPHKRIDLIQFMDLFSISYDKKSHVIELIYDYGSTITIEVQPEVNGMETLYSLIEEKFKVHTSKLSNMF